MAVLSEMLFEFAYMLAVERLFFPEEHFCKTLSEQQPPTSQCRDVLMALRDLVKLGSPHNHQSETSTILSPVCINLCHSRCSVHSDRSR